MWGSTGLSVRSIIVILCINDIFEVSKTLKSILFADDTTLLSCGDNLNQLLDTVESELQMMKSWLDSNKLTLNLRKFTLTLTINS